MPIGDAEQVGVGWVRRYSTGVVLVNPSADTAQTFALGGRYTDADGETMTTITVPPTTGVILQAAATS